MWEYVQAKKLEVGDLIKGIDFDFRVAAIQDSPEEVLKISFRKETDPTTVTYDYSPLDRFRRKKEQNNE